MDIRKKIHSILNEILSPALLNTIEARYKEDLDEGAYDVEERDYNIAIEVLSASLSDADRKLLDSTEHLYQERRDYAAKYGLASGIAYGYAQCLSSPTSEFYDFKHSVCKGLLEIPGMRRHWPFHEACETSLANLKTLEDTLSEEMNEHLVSISLAWDQRIYSAARDAFYLGYQTAYSLMEHLSPTISIHNIARILELEFNLGYTDAYYRRQARI